MRRFHEEMPLRKKLWRAKIHNHLEDLATEGWGQCTNNCQQIVRASLWPRWTLTSMPFGSGHCPTSDCEVPSSGSLLLVSSKDCGSKGMAFCLMGTVKYLLRLRRNIYWSYTESSAAKTERGVTTEASELSDMQGQLPPDSGL
ncbi:hypothetical protein PanWU01x14_175290 [Parasponia andersonii]|uniref:Uncharacterized protein n=1 Tax=Parasponia andersonii TaxID=3476 RepID=A0A2P5C8E4_PARAD|nr:hypothetical protein PanWU01x14_175290 [Parasponia andersonii]